MTNYYRITAYLPDKDISAIFDSFGMFEELWRFSSFLVKKGFKICEVSDADSFLDVNIPRVNPCSDKLYLRAFDFGSPKYLIVTINSLTYNAVQVNDKIYVPNR